MTWEGEMKKSGIPSGTLLNAVTVYNMGFIASEEAWNGSCNGCEWENRHTSVATRKCGMCCRKNRIDMFEKKKLIFILNCSILYYVSIPEICSHLQQREQLLNNLAIIAGNKSE
jgi:hypothetical protein